MLGHEGPILEFASCSQEKCLGSYSPFQDFLKSIPSELAKLAGAVNEAISLTDLVLCLAFQRFAEVAAMPIIARPTWISQRSGRSIELRLILSSATARALLCWFWCRPPRSKICATSCRLRPWKLAGRCGRPNHLQSRVAVAACAPRPSMPSCTARLQVRILGACEVQGGEVP